MPNLDITLVESKHIPNIGVGESTTREIQHWLSHLGIDIKEFMKETDAAYKIGVKFTDFYKIGHSFYTHFGSPDLRRSTFGVADWQVKKRENKDLSTNDYLEQYVPQSVFLTDNKFTDQHIEELYPFNLKTDSGFQVNAVKLGLYLAEKYAMPRGVKRVWATVKNVNGSEEGVSSLTLDDGSTIEADFFIDCTGFKSLLLGGFLKEEFVDTMDMLPNNRAFFCPVEYTDKEDELENFTHSIALKNGWAWNTPLWSRIGTGYAYSAKFVDDETALAEFKNHLDSKNMKIFDPKRSEKVNINQLYIKNGYYKKGLVKNVCAIGLSSAFMDPLEGTGLFFTHTSSLHISNILQKGLITTLDRELFNMQYEKEINAAIRFIRLHFVLSQRNDSEYWKSFTQSESINQDIEHLRSFVYDSNFNMVGNPAFMALLSGMNFGASNTFASKINFYNNFNKVKHSINYSISEQAKVSKSWKEIASGLSSQYKWLLHNIQGE